MPERRFYALEDKIDFPTSLLTGIQHVLAMFVGIITPPLIVAGAILEVLGALGSFGFRRSLQGRLAEDEAAGRPREQRLLEALLLSLAIATASS